MNNGDGGSSPDSDSSDSEQVAKVRKLLFAEGCSLSRGVNTALRAVFRIRKFLGLPDTDPLVRGTDPDPSIFKQYSKRNLDSYCFVTSL